MIVYHNGRFIDKEMVHISPEDRGFLFADAVYEVIRSYKGVIFRLEDHMKRLHRNLCELRLNVDPDYDLGAIPMELVTRNELTAVDATVYMQISRGVAQRSHWFPSAVAPTIYASASPLEPAWEKWRRGMKVICVPDIRWARCDIKTVALLANVLASQHAQEAGADEALFVRDGAVTEGSQSNFCAVFDGQVWTYPQSNYILHGVTRQVVLELCAGLGIPVREYPVMAERLPFAAEAMMLGTTKEVTPVIQIDDYKIGDGSPGPITVALQKAFRDLISAGRNGAA